MSGPLAITELGLSHFRSHLSARLALDGRPVAIFGPNGAGKTNLVEAVSLLSPGRGLRRAAPEDLARAPERIGWKVRAQVSGPGDRHEIATWSDGSGRSVEIDGKPAPQAALGQVLRVLWLTPAMDRLWSEAAGERRRFLDRVSLSLTPEHGQAVLDYEKAMRERNRLLRDQIRDPAWYDALEAQMGRAGARVTAARKAAVVELAAAQAGEGFPRADLGLHSQAPEGAAALAAALRESRARDLAAGRSLTGPHRDDLVAVYAAKDMPAALCSTGEQKALLLGLVLANARAVAASFGAAPVLILDEVAAHLDADRRAGLFEAICTLGAQAWMTGTSAELFAALGDRAMRLRIGEAESISQIS